MNKTLTLASLLCLTPSCLAALPVAQRLPATISADHVSTQRQPHITRFSGHVRMRQGSTLLLANQVTLYSGPHNTMRKIVAIGQPARYQRRLKKSHHILHATAKTIIYYPQSGVIILRQHGHITDGINSISGNEIRYNSKQHTMIATASPHQQTKIIINPTSLKKQ